MHCIDAGGHPARRAADFEKLLTGAIDARR
jgi:hypothetical protein